MNFARAAAAFADIDKCEKAKEAVRNRLAPPLIGWFELLMPEFTENGVLEWEEMVALAEAGKDMKDNVRRVCECVCFFVYAICLYLG